MKKLPIELARQMLKDKSIIPVNGHAYSLFACGHVFDCIEEKITHCFYPGKRPTRKRTCPKCVRTPLLGKYRKCKCGHEFTGQNVQTSAFCGHCEGGIQEKDTHRKTKERMNGHLVDSERWNCAHRRKCESRYIRYETIPCKDCPDYKMKNGNMDAMTSKRILST